MALTANTEDEEECRACARITLSDFLSQKNFLGDRGAVGGEEDDGDGHVEDASQDRDASNGGTSSDGDGSTIVGELSRRERLRAARSTDRRWWGCRSMSFSDL